MRSVQYQAAPDRIAQILRESAIVSRAIARHRREASLQGRIEEAHEMEALYSGVFRMILGFVQPHQRSSNAA
jgi:hypothetical protein